MVKNEKRKYSEIYEELKQILESLEEGEVDVDELSAQVKRASELLELCQSRLKNAQVEVKKVVKKLEDQFPAKEEEEGAQE